MGDGAEYAIQSYIRSGMPELKRNRIVRVECPQCGKEVHGQAALMQHINSKHEPKKYSWNEISRKLDEERYG